ncbi:unnamed protein product [Didymodactylos carnosus]|uniref:Uncharacterized protein n=1 Tax=Didymodactylos carnosus TaxID=1234261 RepID=A0A815C3S9_9BILA|nr:unnamed protein product [Didymodactylos carnosus]CAF4066202.1 unnamed protein product [Didymodactylos carnosus]
MTGALVTTKKGLTLYGLLRLAVTTKSAEIMTTALAPTTISGLLTCNANKNYQLNQDNAIYNDQNYTCPSITLDSSKAYCISTLTTAIQYCDNDINCAGYEYTTNQDWHHTYDRNGSPSVQLYGRSRNATENNGWTTCVKRKSL